MLSIALALLVQTYPGPTPAAGTPVTECVAGERVLVVADEGLFPVSVLGDASAGHCMVLLDERLSLGPIEAGYADLLRGTNPPAPSSDALRFGAMETFSDDDAQRFRHLALDNHADARVFFSRFMLSSYDDTIVARICNRDWEAPVCKRANAQFHGDYDQAMQALDEENARMQAEARAAAAASEPINSGYYQSGQYSRDVAASQAGMPTSSAASSSAPVVVQSESEIVRQQDQCRRGSAAC
jgi:hypothetical protein